MNRIALSASRLSRRRLLLGLGSAAVANVALNPVLGMFDRAFAGGSTFTGYKALVCILLNGGNDGFNMIVPLSANSGGSSDYATYARSRTGIALAQSSFLPLGSGVTASDKNSYGIQSGCCEALQTLFNAGQMAVVANVGTLAQVTTPAAAQSGAATLPNNLFSHFDQVNEWMTSLPSSPAQNVGWAGRLGDFLVSQGTNPTVPLNISLSGNNLLQSGLATSGYAMAPSGPQTLQIGGYSHGDIDSTFHTLLEQGAADSNVMVQTYSNMHLQAAGYVPILDSALTSAGTFTTTFTPPPGDGGNGGLDQLFLAVAKLIKANSALKGTRQVFFLQVNGNDTHANQQPTQQANLKALAPLMSELHAAMKEIGLQNDVTQFTISDFGRSLGSNSGGTDHGWGTHHMVVGGAVAGGKFYGDMPSLVLGGANDFGDGRIIPTTSTDQYIATLLQWFGVSANDVTTLLPNLANFTANARFNFKSATNLGFLG